MTLLLAVEVVLIVVLAGVATHAFLNIKEPDFDHEIDCTPFGMPKE